MIVCAYMRERERERESVNGQSTTNVVSGEHLPPHHQVTTKCLSGPKTDSVCRPKRVGVALSIWVHMHDEQIKLNANSP